MISAIRKVAVKGECIIPAITAAIPTKAKLLSATVISPERFTILATKNPTNPPKNRLGAKVPPTPPELQVTAVAMALKNTIATRTIKKVNSLST